jgi:ribonuclease VapC
VKKYVMDSFAMIAFFEDEPGAEMVELILKSLMARKAKAYMSIINWGEIYYNTLREQGVETAEAVIEQLKQYPIELVDADKKLTYEAAKLKGRHKIAYADCFAAALSRTLDAVLVTGDPEFKKLGNKYLIQWLN